MRGMTAARAYRKSATHRSFREQEADVFHLVNARLRSVQQVEGIARATALADNERLWITVMDMLRDPGNGLPQPLRASILSVAHAVRREIAVPAPDLGFLIGINEQIAAGLAGR